MLLCTMSILHGQKSVFLQEEFSSRSNFIDLSTLYLNTGDSSYFQIDSIFDTKSIGYNAIRLKPDGEGKGSPSVSASHTAIDFKLPKIDRSGDDSIIVEFDLLFATVGSSGNNGRVDLFLIHSYPDSIPIYEGMSNSSVHQYGRPAYNVRMHNGYLKTGMVIGGGSSINGEFNYSTTSNFWLPGFLGVPPADPFISEFKDPISVADMFPNPLSRWRGTSTLNTASKDYWMHYTLVITKDSLALYYKNTNDTLNKLVTTLVTPLTKDDITFVNQRYGTAVTSLFDLYNYFSDFNAIRFYWRSSAVGQNASLANIKMSKTGEPLTSIVKFNSSFSPSVLKTEGVYNMAFNVTRPSSINPISFDLVLENGDSTAIKNYTTQRITIPAGQSTFNYPVQITIDSVNRTSFLDYILLDFKIQNVSGGTSAIAGSPSSHQLVITDDQLDVNQFLIEKIKVFPIPSSDQLTVDIGLIPQGKATIITLTGMSVLETILGSGVNQLDVSGLSAGSYLLVLDLNENKLTKKIFISR